jgi:DNA-binding transcriptional regulator GbsR (MarR family)
MEVVRMLSKASFTLAPTAQRRMFVSFGSNRTIRTMPTRTQAYREAVAKFEEGVARICDLYGITPLTGRLYASLFLSPEPVSLEELADRVGAAKSTVSVALRKLLSARVVRRQPTRGDRRDYYEAVTDPWAALSDWIRLFFTPELEMWKETSSDLVAALASAKDAPKAAENAEIKRRIAELGDFASGVMELLAMLEQRRIPRPAARSIPVLRKERR